MRIGLSWRLVVSLCLMATALPVNAVLRIEITQGLSRAQPIAIVPFGVEGNVPLAVADVIASDLTRSGRFKVLPVEDMLEQPTAGKDIQFKNWRIFGVENVVVGKVIQTESGFLVQFQLYDVFRGQQLLGLSLPVGSSRLRRVAHEVSDLRYEELTGIPGAFSTRIAYITADGTGEQRRYALFVADSDGANQHRIVRSPQPIMSPVWSPDGRQLAYVSFENQRAEVFIQDLFTGERESVSSRAGINGAPAFSPDGKKLALTLSSEPGNPDIYVLDIESRRLQRLTRNPFIDTEPSWHPDGDRLFFTSDRSGRPQIYEINVQQRRAKRLTFEGRYNARPVVSPDGETLAMVHLDREGYNIAVLSLKTRALRILTDGRLDESPSFAPNGTMIIYATESDGRGILSAVSVDGRVRQRLGVQEGDVREPAWSPRLSGSE
ncbi:MAG: Tol-Pal system beta propeller repeat protein TolB [Gammaproteobacteria bacterium]